MDPNLRMIVLIEVSSIPILSFVLLSIWNKNTQTLAMGFAFFFILYGLRRYIFKKKFLYDSKLASKITEKDILTAENKLSEISEFSSRSKFSSYLKEIRHQSIEKSLEKYKSKELPYILDAGCGEGEILISLAKKGLNGVGVDFSKKHIRSAKEKLIFLNLSKKMDLILCNVECLPFQDDVFDFVILSEILEHVISERKCILAVKSVIKPRGLLVLTTPNATKMPLSLNPFVWIEVLIGQYLNRVLAYRSMLVHLSKPIIHKDFTRNELKRLFQDVNLKVVESKSVGLNILYQAAYFTHFFDVFIIFARITERIFGKIPLIKGMGYYLYVICRKS